MVSAMRVTGLRQGVTPGFGCQVRELFAGAADATLKAEGARPSTVTSAERVRRAAGEPISRGVSGEKPEGDFLLLTRQLTSQAIKGSVECPLHSLGETATCAVSPA